MTPRRSILGMWPGALLLAVALAGAPVAQAPARGATVMPLSEVVPTVRETVPGRLMSARLRGTTYLIRILTPNGTVVEVRADGHSGRIIGMQGSD